MKITETELLNYLQTHKSKGLQEIRLYFKHSTDTEIEYALSRLFAQGMIQSYYTGEDTIYTTTRYSPKKSWR